MTSSILDVDYCSVQAGKPLSRWAAAWWVAAAVPSRSPHPLVEPAWMLVHRDDPRPWVSHLYRRGAGHTELGPALTAAPGRTPARRLARFLLVADDDTVVPAAAPGAAGVTLGELRRIATTSAAESVVQSQRSRSRARPAWNARSEREFWATLTPIPADTDDPLVTIVMAVRDGAPTIARAISSVRAQSFRGWRLVVVDDGSSDGTVRAAETAAAGDPRIAIVSAPPRGVAAARNRGVGEARTVFVAFLDADNAWRPGYLLGIVSTMIARGAPIAHSAVCLHEDDGVRYLGDQVGYLELRDGANVVDLNALVVRREVLDEVGGFDETLARWVDYDLVLRLLRTRPAVYCAFVGVDYDHRASRPDRITTRESRHWREVVLSPHFVDWNAFGSERVAGRVSVVIPITGDLGSALTTVDTAFALPAGGDIEIVVVDGSGDPALSRALRVAYAAQRVVVIRLARDHAFSMPCNIGFLASTGERVILASESILRGSDVVEVRASDYAEAKGLNPALPEGDAISDLVDRIRRAGGDATVRATSPGAAR